MLTIPCPAQDRGGAAGGHGLDGGQAWRRLAEGLLVARRAAFNPRPLREAQEDRTAQEEHASKAVARAAPSLPSDLAPAVLAAAAGEGVGAWRKQVCWEAAFEVIYGRLSHMPTVTETLRDVWQNLAVAALRGDGGELLGAASTQGTGVESEQSEGLPMNPDRNMPIWTARPAGISWSGRQE